MANSVDHRAKLLSFEAKRWIGTREEGKNGGQIIQMFQRAIDDYAQGESWCMAFAQYCIKMAASACAELFPDEAFSASSIHRSEHCLTVWNRSSHLQTRQPEKGALCIWQRFNGREPTSNGHTGVVIEVHGDGSISIVEGNARDPEKGEGVWLRRYSTSQLNHGSLFLKGFLRVW
jgi:hypothetical protein